MTFFLKGIDPKQLIVTRHRPHEPELNKVLPWLAAEKPGGDMVEVQENLAKLPAGDRQAIAVYLKSPPATPTPLDP